MSTSSSYPGAAAILAGFPKPVLSVVAVTGESIPTFATLKVLQSELNENAQSIQSNLGDGLSGHLVLTLSPEAYATLTDVPFVVPVNPGPSANAADNPTVAVLTAREKTHRISLQNFHMYRNTDLALKQQLLAACPPAFIQTLRHPDLGFARVSTLQLLTHLHATYGKVSPTDIMKKYNELNTPFWSPPLPLESLFADILDKKDYLISNGCITDPLTFVTSAYLNFEATGLYTDDCTIWRKKPIADQTWDNLVQFFTDAEADRNRITAADMNFHSANAATIAPAPVYCPSINAATTDPAISAVLAGMMNLTKMLQHQNRRVKNTRPNRNSAAASTLPSNNKSYCYTHGYTDNISHNSQTCRNKGPNHIDTATAPNPKNPNGGSSYVYTEADRRFQNPTVE